MTFKRNFGAKPMRIAIVGGIYGRDESFRRKLQVTPETILERGFAARGCEIRTFSHYAAIDMKQVDVVHVHHLSYGAVRAAVDKSQAAFVYTSHDPHAMSGLLHLHRQFATQFVVSCADAVVALSKSEAEYQQRSYHLAGARHAVIPNGIDSANYTYARNNAAGRGRPWQLLYVGQLNALKSVDVLMRALPQVKQPVELELVYHNSTLEIPLRKLAWELGLSERIRFLGPKNPRELAAMYQRADAFVLPSAGEALPTVVTEAMFCGTPVVATDVGGVREQLHGYGLCVPPGRPDELGAAITCMFDRYEHFAAQSESASTYAKQRFAIEAMVDRHLELYADLLNKKGPRRRHKLFRVPIDAALKMGISLICATKCSPRSAFR